MYVTQLCLIYFHKSPEIFFLPTLPFFAAFTLLPLLGPKKLISRIANLVKTLWPGSHIFGIWISDFRVWYFEEGGTAELGGGAECSEKVPGKVRDEAR